VKSIWLNKGDESMSDEQRKVHPRAALDGELMDLKEELIRLGDQVESAVARAMTALKDRDQVLAQEVIADDLKINARRYEIEEKSLSIIATQQPAAGDLRAIVAVMNMVSDLERMGDHAAGIATLVTRMESMSGLEMPTGLATMSKMARGMLREALNAYAEHDVQAGYAIAGIDDEIDTSYTNLFRDLVKVIIKKPDTTSVALYYLFAGHNLERIADRVTNLAERVIFMGSGQVQELNPEPDETGFN
jgi:phosphate transport system protein